MDAAIHGNALLISFWSNEFGSEVCVIDQLYVDPVHRGGFLQLCEVEDPAGSQDRVDWDVVTFGGDGVDRRVVDLTVEDRRQN